MLDDNSHYQSLGLLNRTCLYTIHPQSRQGRQHCTCKHHTACAAEASTTPAGTAITVHDTTPNKPLPTQQPPTCCMKQSIDSPSSMPSCIQKRAGTQRQHNVTALAVSTSPRLFALPHCHACALLSEHKCRTTGKPLLTSTGSDSTACPTY